MKCEKILEMFSEYIDHQLDKKDIEEFENHMHQCEKCQNEFSKFEKMIIKLKSIKDIHSPADLKNKIMQKVTLEENKKLNAKIIVFKKLSLFAAALSVFFIGYNYYNQKIISKNVDEPALTSFDTYQNEMPIPRSKGLSDESVINIYKDGIEVTINASDIENTKKIIENFTENILFYEESPNYLEVVITKNEFLELNKELELNNIKISNYDANIQKIDEIIASGEISESDLILFKVSISNN